MILLKSTYIFRVRKEVKPLSIVLWNLHAYQILKNSKIIKMVQLLEIKVDSYFHCECWSMIYGTYDNVDN